MPTKTIVYLSGPMSGIPEWNFPAFDAASETLRRLGYRVINPADFGADEKWSWADCLARDLQFINHAAIVCQLPGWEDSRGANLEADVARRLGKAVVSFDELVRVGTIAGNAA